MESTTFFPAVIETRLKRGAVYEYRIVNQSISENLPQVVYTTTEKAHVLENQQLVVHEATSGRTGIEPVHLEREAGCGQRIGNRQFYCNRGCNDICCVGTMEKKGKKEQ